MHDWLQIVESVLSRLQALCMDTNTDHFTLLTLRMLGKNYTFSFLE